MVKVQKQHSRSVLGKRCSENIPQIYRKTQMPKCDFNKVALFQSEYKFKNNIKDSRDADCNCLIYRT